jgi:glycosyltransferase involved in cell wall biosynthesis
MSPIADDTPGSRPMTEVSVIIPALNAAEFIGRQLAALARQVGAPDFEVVVADNGSTDDTAEVVSQWADRLTIDLVDASDRRGQAHARNVAVRASEGQLVLLSDADDEVSTGWVAAMIECLAAFDLAGGPVRLDRINDSLPLSWRMFNFASDRLPVGDFWPFAMGNNCAFRRDVFDTLNGFDEDFHGGEDVDFAWRARLAGFELGFAPNAVVDYRMRSDLRSLYHQSVARAREEKLLYERFAVHGMPRPRWTRPRISWMATRTPLALLNARHRGLWVRQLGFLRGSLSRRPAAHR